jgi:hypothetical protein
VFQRVERWVGRSAHAWGTSMTKRMCRRVLSELAPRSGVPPRHSRAGPAERSGARATRAPGAVNSPRRGPFPSGLRGHPAGWSSPQTPLGALFGFRRVSFPDPVTGHARLAMTASERFGRTISICS